MIDDAKLNELAAKAERAAEASANVTEWDDLGDACTPETIAALVAEVKRLRALIDAVLAVPMVCELHSDGSDDLNAIGYNAGIHAVQEVLDGSQASQ